VDVAGPGGFEPIWVQNLRKNCGKTMKMTEILIKKWGRKAE
jgi:hypothetical protein